MLSVYYFKYRYFLYAVSSVTSVYGIDIYRFVSRSSWATMLLAHVYPASYLFFNISTSFFNSLIASTRSGIRLSYFIVK